MDQVMPGSSGGQQHRIILTSCFPVCIPYKPTSSTVLRLLSLLFLFLASIAIYLT